MASIKTMHFRLLLAVGLLLCVGFIRVHGQDAPGSEPGDEPAIRSLENGLELPFDAVGSIPAMSGDNESGEQETDDLDEDAPGSLEAIDSENAAFEVQLHALLLVVAPLLLSFFV